MNAHVHIASLEWSEKERNASKPCVECGEPTQGRVVTGGKTKPAHAGCALRRALKMAKDAGGPNELPT